MRRTATLALGAALGLSLVTALGGCSKKEETPAEPPPPTAAPAAETPPPAEPPPAEAMVDEAEDSGGGGSITILATHAPPKPDDPVKVMIQTFQVTNVTYEDPDNLEGATATIELDLASISSGSDKRDGHLRSPDYLEVETHPKATITVTDVKKKAGDTYTAKAMVDAHGMKVTRDVEFEVVDKTGDGIMVKAMHKFLRSDFGLGKSKDDPATPELEIQLEMMLSKRT